ncbi:UNVERIFIED_CONTAM: Multiple C2 and transmembrane domain-containing protein 1 [Gekko kuhli]
MEADPKPQCLPARIYGQVLFRGYLQITVGTSDPYVKFKIGGKEVFRSKTIHKNLNPVWEERTSIFVEQLREQLYIKVFDYDFGLQDDFMGSAFLDLSSLEQNRTFFGQ